MLHEELATEWPIYWWRFTLTMGLLPLGTQFGCKSNLISSSDCLNGLDCLRMHPRQKSWYASWDGFARPTHGRAVCRKQISDWSSRRQQASLGWLWEWWCQPCSWTLQVTAWHFLIYSSPTRDCGWSSTCNLLCYPIDCRGQVHLPGTVLHWQGKHKVEPETALLWGMVQAWVAHFVIPLKRR